MCGLNFTWKGSKRLIEMNKKIHHRGIRSQYTEFLGHVRLPIQGLSTDYDCPYQYGDWEFVLVGEIYNYKKLLPDAQSDVEVLAKYWAEYGINCFRYFDGMWSVIILDQVTGELHVIVDPLAKKPLYYNDDFEISSEIKSLINDNSFPDFLFLSTVLQHGYSMSSRTSFRNIKKVKPGTHTILKIGKKKPRLLEQSEYYPLKPAYFNSLEEEMEISVVNRLVSDEPVSFLVSGGLDSSIVYNLADNKEATVFHVDNGEDEYLEYLDIPSDKLIKLDMPEMTDDLLIDILYANESPVDLGSMIQQYLLCEAISKTGIRVCLTGDGADELFLGYTRGGFYDSRMNDIFNELVYYHLPRLDKMSMFHTVELRSPFLNFDVVKNALSYSYEQARSKKILKERFVSVVPDCILYREKKALKSKYVISDPIQWRMKLNGLFINEVVPLYKKDDYEHPRHRN